MVATLIPESPYLAGRAAVAELAPSFIDGIIASWQPQPQPSPTEASALADALIAEISEVMPCVVINLLPGAEYFDDDELRCLGSCDRTLGNPIRYRETSYLMGYLKQARLIQILPGALAPHCGKGL